MVEITLKKAQWVFACDVSILKKGASLGFELAMGGGIFYGFVVRDERAKLRAYKNSCPHTGAPLNWTPDKFLSLGAEYIQCSLHGAKFSILEGQCLLGPCVGKSLVPLKVLEKSTGFYIDISSLAS